MINRKLILATLSASLLAGAAIAQTSAPNPPSSSTGSAPATTTQAKAPETNLAGQGKWRASKLMGVDIYGPDDKKVGDVTEVILDKTGKIEMVTVGVGGFLGIGSKDVAIPYEQVTWSDQPMAAAAPAPAPAGGAAGTGAAGTSGSMASPPATASAPKAPAMYPDHGKISMTKDQLTAAPAVTYSGN
jgi:sporulation protein YlmC with PRC-barrel domain